MKAEDVNDLAQKMTRVYGEHVSWATAIAAVAPLIAAAEREACTRALRLKCGAHTETAVEAIRTRSAP